MVTLRVEVKAKGPLFRRGVPKRVMDKHVKATIQDLVELGEHELHRILRPRPAGVFLSVAEAQRGKASVGTYRLGVMGRVQPGGGGVIEQTGTGAVYGPWLEGVSPRNFTTRFRGYNSFRRTSQWLERQAKKVLQSHVVRMARELRR